MNPQYSLEEIQEYLAKQEEVASFVPEETHTFELTKSPGQKLGVIVVGGSDHPNLKEVHVRRILVDGFARRDGRLKCGDRIVSVNGLSLSGLDEKSALRTLRDAMVGEKVVLAIRRKLGRRTTLAPTPMPGSNCLSRRSSVEKRKAGGLTSSHGATKVSSPLRGCASTAYTRKSTCEDRAALSPNTMPRRLSSMVGVKAVEVDKGPIGLGIQLAGGKDISDPVTVKFVIFASPAHKNGNIHTGDIIIEANGISFEDLTHDEAIGKMRGFQGKVRLIMRDRMAVAANALAPMVSQTSSK